MIEKLFRQDGDTLREYTPEEYAQHDADTKTATDAQALQITQDVADTSARNTIIAKLESVTGLTLAQLNSVLLAP